MNRRHWLRNTLLGTAAIGYGESASFLEAQGNGLRFSNFLVDVQVVGSAATAWKLTAAEGRTYNFAPPVFELNGTPVTAALENIQADPKPRQFGNGVAETRFSGRLVNEPSLSLEMVFRLSPDNPVVRFRYVLRGGPEHKLTASRKKDQNLCYLRCSLAALPDIREVRASVFNDLLHSYTLSESSIPGGWFADNVAAMGPLLVGADAQGHTLVLAYEHGSESPDAFLQFELAADRSVSLAAVKGNYLINQPAAGYETVWMEAGAASGGVNKMAKHFRRFVLRYLNVYGESRKPYIFYNTWNFQERNKWWNGKKYLDSMTPERMLAEIDAAHRMGIEVFVMDTGWYEKTGDWQVSHQRFPDGLKQIKARLDQYGMKLGLWFNPTAAALSSNMLARYRTSVRSRNGQEGKPAPIWETEASYPMCLVSPYSDGFADVLIQVAQETGARYFKWDAIGQYGCDSPNHWHGGPQNTAEERANSYAFQLPLQMARIVDKLSAAIPDAIVDFDITESGRAVGLSFLSAGKYFLINNGPYLFNYDLPLDREHQNWNLFFYPGPARTWICRSPLNYDRWIPSTLFLTHYFPDDPASSQLVNVASLILGQNGIWGDLPKVSNEGISSISEVLQRYKQVREDVTESDPHRSGAVGSSPEVHEKISDRSGKGAVVIFSTAHGRFSYITAQRPVQKHWSTPGTSIRYDGHGHAVIEAEFKASGAAIVFFGAA